jgi:hypothetical protein
MQIARHGLIVHVGLLIILPCFKFPQHRLYYAGHASVLNPAEGFRMDGGIDL